MIKRLQSRIKRDGIGAVAAGLGYRSYSTIYNWIRTGKIPDISKGKVKFLLKNNKKKKV